MTRHINWRGVIDDAVTEVFDSSTPLGALGTGQPGRGVRTSVIDDATLRAAHHGWFLPLEPDDGVTT